MATMEEELVVILDAGAQYGKLIDRKVRELSVCTELLPLSTPAADLKARLPALKAIILSGGPSSVYAADAPKFDGDVFHLGVPVLGICYGFQLVNQHFKGTVGKRGLRHDGQHETTVEPESPLFRGLDKKQLVLLTHGDSVDQLAEGFREIARSDDIVTGLDSVERRIYAVQFHPEVDLSVNGVSMIRNFLFDVAKCSGGFTIASREDIAIKEIRGIVGDKKVLVLLSGGVDSSVCAALLTRALPAESIIAVHIDNGFMRQRESQAVAVSLERLGLPLRVIDAAEDFFNATTTIQRRDGTEYETAKLKEVVAPEEKRKIIGDTFIRVTEAHLATLKLKADEVFLAQGTLRPDLIESASKIASSHADTIKTHHNDTQLVRALRDAGRVVEPLKDYHKDEVRQLGTALGLPDDLVQRQPFPGPGLAIRVLCASEPYMQADFAAGNAQLQEIVDAQTSAMKECRATLLPIRTVGVQGDGRTYSYVAAVSSANGPDWGALMALAKQIPMTCHYVNRVVYVWGAPVPGPIKSITPTVLCPTVLATLRAADDIVNSALAKHNLITTISQVPVVCVPVDFEAAGAGEAPTAKHSIVIRTFMTADFMTGVPAVPGKQMPLDVLDGMVKGVQAVEGVSRVMYDLTAKPPGTTEWE